MKAIGFDELEQHKAKIKRLRGSLSRELLRAISFRLAEVFPEATHIHIVLYPDNVYRVWAVSQGKRWLAVCADDVAPTWSSINLDNDIDLVVRLAWSPRINTYIRKDGVEVHSLALQPRGSSKKKVSRGRDAARHVDEAQAPAAQNGGTQQEHGRHFDEAGQAHGQHSAQRSGHEHGARDGAGLH